MKKTKEKKGFLYLGFDVGGTNIRAGIVDSSGRIKHLLREKVEDSSPELFFNKLRELANRAIELSPREKIEAAGFGIAGFIDFTTFIMDKSPNLSVINGRNLKEELNHRISLPIFIENDANAAALAEKLLGWGKEVDSLVFITIGTGLGSGLIFKGKIWHGARGFGGELGHTTLYPDGIECRCGNVGCLETVVSGSGIERRAKYYIAQKYPSSLSSYPQEKITSKLVYQEAVKGDTLAARVLEETGQALGIALANIINLLNIELIVLGGKVMKASDFILPAALKEAEKRAVRGSFSSVSIKLSRLGEDAGVIGAALLAAQGMKESKI